MSLGHKKLPEVAASVQATAKEDPDTVALMQRVSTGDQVAFERLYDMFSGRVYGLSFNILKNHAMAEEVAQEVMLEVWKGAARYQAQKGSVKTWVLTLAHHRAVDRVRSSESARTRDDKVYRQDAATPSQGVAEEVESRLIAEEVRLKMDVLSPSQKEALQLAYYDGLSQREISSVLHVPLGTIKTRVRDGLIRLRGEMERK